MLSRVEGNSTVEREVHPLNADEPRDVPAFILKVVNPVQFSKAPLSIDAFVSMVLIKAQYSKA